MDEWIELLKEVEDVNFQEITDVVGKIVKDGRELKYEEGEIGITTLLDCPKKAKLIKLHGYPPVDSLAIEEGFLFEKVIKLALKKTYGDKFKEELELPYEVEGLKIRGHLDCAIFFPNTIVGIELKHTIMESYPELKIEPPKIIVLNPDNPEIKLNPKYIKQAKIQKFLLEKLYPDKNVKQYLFVKTTLRGAYRYFKCYLVQEIKESISEDEFIHLVRHFKLNDYPLDPSACRFCYFKNKGFCEGIEDSIKKGSKTARIIDLINRREELIAELEAIEKTIKKELKNSNVEINGKVYGQVEYVGYQYDTKKLIRLIKQKGFQALPFLQIKPKKMKDIEFLLGDEIEKARTPVKKKKFVFGEPKS